MTKLEYAASLCKPCITNNEGKGNDVNPKYHRDLLLVLLDLVIPESLRSPTPFCDQLILPVLKFSIH